jgi:hypothetical protein
MSAQGHEGRFAWARLSAGCGFRKKTVAGTHRKERDAPTPVVRANTIDRLKSTHTRRWQYR